MKHSISIFAAALLCLVSCQEFQPVFIGKYTEPGNYKTYTDADFSKLVTVKDVAACYTPGSPFVMPGNNAALSGAVLKGRVSTTDQPGNFYKSFYIQDETGGMEIKMGKNGLYNDYLPGQTVYVKLDELSLGMYGYKSGTTYGGMGMVQVGFIDPTAEYETSYLESSLLIDTHILRGDPKDIQIVTPITLTESQLPNPKTDTPATNSNVGKVVTLEGLEYANEVFALLYVDSNANHKLSSNRIFLSDKTWGINSLAMSESMMSTLLESGIWDEVSIGNSGDYNYGKVGDEKYKGADGTYPGISRSAYSVSQYFKMGNTEIQIRTSGYSKFGDKMIPADVRDGSRKITVTGVLTLYQGSFQLTVNSVADFVYADNGKPLFD